MKTACKNQKEGYNIGVGGKETRKETIQAGNGKETKKMGKQAQIDVIVEGFKYADKHGPAVIRNVFKQAFNEQKGNTEGLTSLTMAVIREFWTNWNDGKEDIAALYKEFYHQCREYAYTTLSGDKLYYFIQEIG